MENTKMVRIDFILFIPMLVIGMVGYFYWAQGNYCMLIYELVKQHIFHYVYLLHLYFQE